ncbi:MAG: nitronate monooxygenase [Solirubrobacteraceae bacterium]
MLDRLAVPIVQAPMAGGPSTPALAAAVTNAGGLGFVAAGYKAPDAFAADLEATRALADGPIGANLFAPGGAPADPAAVAAYAERLAPEAERAGVALGEPRFDDDAFDAKLAVLRDRPVAVVSFTFACPAPDVVAATRATGADVWVTVTHPDEARAAVAAGADALVVQGAEAGGHRGSFDDGPADIGLLALLALVRAAADVPLVAAGGIATGAGIAAVLAGGASAAALGTAFMRTPEAGTAPVHRAALAAPGTTALTRAFSGRLARGIENRLLREHTAAAPRAYPEVHHLTTPLRAHGRAHGDADLINLWAGQTHELAPELPAAELVARLADEAHTALVHAARGLG